MKWIIAANGKMYNHKTSFEKRGYIDWRQTANFEVGDIIYIYSTAPLSKVEYKCIVEKTNISFEDITDDREFWMDKDEYEKSQYGYYSRLRLLQFIDTDKLSLANLKEHGLKAAPQGPTRLMNDRISVADYIEEHFTKETSSMVFPDEVESESVYEGAVREVKVNKYERSSKARQQCIDYFGSSCSVCGVNFGKKYGRFAEGFIHVHHLIPISEIGEEYEVNYKKDLVPVCPNCHAVLHMKIDGEYPTIQEVQEMLLND